MIEVYVAACENYCVVADKNGVRSVLDIELIYLGDESYLGRINDLFG